MSSSKISIVLSATALLVAVLFATPLGQAAGKLVLASNSVGSRQVVNGSLQTLDLSKKARAALKGTRSLPGPVGAQGPKGDPGSPGPSGPSGDALGGQRRESRARDGQAGRLRRVCARHALDSYSSSCDV
jgi:hypothetical protein